MNPTNWTKLAGELRERLNLQNPPLAITFSNEPPAGVERYQADMPEPTSDGRTGKVSAGCVFWMKAAEATFTTVADDHANCSVGSVTHGFKTLDDVGTNEDVAALLESGWVTMDVVPQIPVVQERYQYVSYGPLEETPVAPDVVFARLNPKQLMILHDAVPELRFEGKPQCHIVAIAKEQGRAAVSVGCMLSRVRTGMPNSELTCAIPANKLADVVERLGSTCAADGAVADYAAQDAKRFA
jgi:uncharacterized protein (DUF169 family)